MQARLVPQGYPKNFRRMSALILQSIHIYVCSVRINEVVCAFNKLIYIGFL